MKKILVVEDEYYARKSIVKILQESDLDIQVCGEAENGMKAIELLEEYKDIALVITDIQMQKMGGLELASYLHKHIPEIDVLILTAFENFDYAREALRYNVKDYIVKPIYKENLLPPVKKVLEKQEEKSRNQEKIKNYYQWEAAKNYFPVKTIVAHEELYKEFFSYKAKVKDILTYATENKFGVAAINTLNIETVKYVIEAAERERVPIIVQFYPGFSDYTDLKHLAFAACDMAEKASIPVGVHLDHSVTYEIAVGGIRDGFPSVMIDGSTKSFQENVELTKNVVRVAKVFGVDVEAELGHVGNGDSIDAIDNTNYYTKVEDAVRFVEQTGCDSLAIAVGNAHGPYVKTPNLDLERIYAIRKKVNIPLVLHGCSDIPEEQMKEAVNLGMSKFNIATEYFRTMYQSIEKRINNQEFEGNGVKLMYDIKEEMIDFVIQKIRLLNPNKYSM